MAITHSSTTRSKFHMYNNYWSQQRGRTCKSEHASLSITVTKNPSILYLSLHFNHQAQINSHSIEIKVQNKNIKQKEKTQAQTHFFVFIKVKKQILIKHKHIEELFEMNVVVRFTRAMEWRGLVYTVFILNFVFACQLLLLQPLVSALGLYFDLSFVFLYYVVGVSI